MAAHRYWRLYTTTPTFYGLYNTIVIEFEFGEAYFPDDFSDTLSGGTATACSVDYGLVASNACDNNGSTYWQSAATNPNWWAYDFGEGNEKDIVTVRVINHSSYPEWVYQNFYVQYSDNGSDWYTSWYTKVDHYEQEVFNNTSAVISSDQRVYSASLAILSEVASPSTATQPRSSIINT